MSTTWLALVVPGFGFLTFLVGLLIPSPLMRAQQHLYEAQALQAQALAWSTLHEGHADNANQITAIQHRLDRLEADRCRPA